MTNDKIEELYRKYHCMVKDIAYKVLDNRTLAEDVCHDVFLKLSEEWINEDIFPRNREGYLKVLALHKAIDYLRGLQNEHCVWEFPTEKIEGRIEEGDLAKWYIYREFALDILYRLKEHNENWYMAVLKREVCHEPVTLIARELGISATLTRMWIFRGKKWIKKNYRKEYDDLC